MDPISTAPQRGESSRLKKELKPAVVVQESSSSPHLRLREEMKAPEKQTPGFEAISQTGVICTFIVLRF